MSGSHLFLDRSFCWIVLGSLWISLHSFGSRIVSFSLIVLCTSLFFSSPRAGSACTHARSDLSRTRGSLVSGLRSADRSYRTSFALLAVSGLVCCAPRIAHSLTFHGFASFWMVLDLDGSWSHSLLRFHSYSHGSQFALCVRFASGSPHCAPPGSHLVFTRSDLDSFTHSPPGSFSASPLHTRLVSFSRTPLCASLHSLRLFTFTFAVCARISFSRLHAIFVLRFASFVPHSHASLSLVLFTLLTPGPVRSGYSPGSFSFLSFIFCSFSFSDRSFAIFISCGWICCAHVCTLHLDHTHLAFAFCGWISRSHLLVCTHGSHSLDPLPLLFSAHSGSRFLPGSLAFIVVAPLRSFSDHTLFRFLWFSFLDGSLLALSVTFCASFALLFLYLSRSVRITTSADQDPRTGSPPASRAHSALTLRVLRMDGSYGHVLWIFGS